ncbi:MAG: hypothetical protein IMY86_06710 [Chloroflexi bacterium]|nr:hypothetical protein [Chloroflexota bacterium]
MPKTRYDELREASVHTRDLLENYEVECRDFIRQLRTELASYLECPVSRIEWLQFSESEPEEKRRAKDVIDVTLDRRMALQDNAFYQFAFKIVFDVGWVSLSLTVKQVDGHFIVDLGDHERKLRQDNQDDLQQLLEHLFDLTKEYLETDFANFVHGKPSRLGFRVSQ